jgi:hypothetical protein
MPITQPRPMLVLAASMLFSTIASAQVGLYNVNATSFTSNFGPHSPIVAHFGANVWNEGGGTIRMRRGPDTSSTDCTVGENIVFASSRRLPSDPARIVWGYNAFCIGTVSRKIYISAAVLTDQSGSETESVKAEPIDGTHLDLQSAVTHELGHFFRQHVDQDAQGNPVTCIMNSSQVNFADPLLGVTFGQSQRHECPQEGINLNSDPADFSQRSWFRGTTSICSQVGAGGLFGPVVAGGVVNSTSTLVGVRYTTNLGGRLEFFDATNCAPISSRPQIVTRRPALAFGHSRWILATVNARSELEVRFSNDLQLWQLSPIPLLNVQQRVSATLDPRSRRFVVAFSTFGPPGYSGACGFSGQPVCLDTVEMLISSDAALGVPLTWTRVTVPQTTSPLAPTVSCFSWTFNNCTPSGCSGPVTNEWCDLFTSTNDARRLLVRTPFVINGGVPTFAPSVELSRVAMGAPVSSTTGGDVIAVYPGVDQTLEWLYGATPTSQLTLATSTPGFFAGSAVVLAPLLGLNQVINRTGQ